MYQSPNIFIQFAQFSMAIELEEGIKSGRIVLTLFDPG
jgi:hypothetical protein